WWITSADRSNTRSPRTMLATRVSKPGAHRARIETLRSSSSPFRSPRRASTCRLSCEMPKSISGCTRRRNARGQEATMPDYTYPGVYIEESGHGPRPIAGVSTMVVAFLGFAERGPLTPAEINSLSVFIETFGSCAGNGYLTHAIRAFFANG